jgi:hypothetical protein
MGNHASVLTRGKKRNVQHPNPRSNTNHVAALWIDDNDNLILT